MPKTFKQFASEQGITVPAVDKMVKKYHEELKDHVNTSQRPKLLDDYAVDFLRKQREAITVVNQMNYEQLKRLQEENENLKSIIIQLQQEALNHMKELSAAQLECNNLKHQIELKEIETESKYQKSLFGLYRKVKQ